MLQLCIFFSFLVSVYLFKSIFILNIFLDLEVSENNIEMMIIIVIIITTAIIMIMVILIIILATTRKIVN